MHWEATVVFHVCIGRVSVCGVSLGPCVRPRMASKPPGDQPVGTDSGIFFLAIKQGRQYVSITGRIITQWPLSNRAFPPSSSPPDWQFSSSSLLFLVNHLHPSISRRHSSLFLVLPPESPLYTSLGESLHACRQHSSLPFLSLTSPTFSFLSTLPSCSPHSPSTFAPAFACGLFLQRMIPTEICSTLRSIREYSNSPRL